MTVFSGQVSQSSDDAAEASTGGVSVTGLTLPNSNTAGLYWGFRWQNVTVPNAATISTCTVALWCTGTSGMDSAFDFQNAASPATFSATSANISSRTLTGNSTTWNPGSTTSGAFNNVADQTTAFQALVNLGSWASGDSAVCVAHRFGSGSAVEAYDGNSSEAAEISITYSGGGGTPSGLSVTSTTSTTATLSWTQGSGTLTDSKVQWITGSFPFTSDNGNTITTVDLGTAETSCTITGLPSNTFVFFQVQATNTSGSSGWSNTAVGFTGNSCTLTPTSDITTTGWTNEGGSGSFSAALTDGSDTTYGLSPTSTSEPLVLQLTNPPGGFGTAIAVCTQLRVYNSAEVNQNVMNGFVYESNGSTELAGGGAEPGPSAAGWIYSVDTTDPFGTTLANWTNAQLSLTVPSGIGGPTDVFEAGVIVGYNLAPSAPVPLAGPQSTGACPFGVTNQMRRNRIEGVRFRHKTGY